MSAGCRLPLCLVGNMHTRTWNGLWSPAPRARVAGLLNRAAGKPGRFSPTQRHALHSLRARHRRGAVVTFHLGPAQQGELRSVESRATSPCFSARVTYHMVTAPAEPRETGLDSAHCDECAGGRRSGAFEDIFCEQAEVGWRCASRASTWRMTSGS